MRITIKVEDYYSNNSEFNINKVLEYLGKEFIVKPIESSLILSPESRQHSYTLCYLEQKPDLVYHPKTMECL